MRGYRDPHPSLPPGVTPSMIPGSRPEDAAWDDLVKRATEDLGWDLVSERLHVPLPEEGAGPYEGTEEMLWAYIDREDETGVSLEVALWPVEGRLKEAREGLADALQEAHGRGLTDHMSEQDTRNVKHLLNVMETTYKFVGHALNHLEDE